MKEETKSLNKAEKRLKFLKKKLESMNLSYVSGESENSSYVDHGEVSSIPSTAYSSTKDSAHCYQEMEKTKTENENPGAHPSESLSGKFEMKEAGDAIEENMNSLGEANLVKSNKLEFNGNHDLSMADRNRYVNLQSLYTFIH